MTFSSDDDTLPDMQLLHEQEVAKLQKERIALPPSLFDAVTPPKATSKLKFQSQSTTNPVARSGVKGKKKKLIVAKSSGETNKVGINQAEPQIRKSLKEKTTKVTAGQTASSTSSNHSDHASAAENVDKCIEPIPRRRRRLIQKKYLTSDDDDDDDDQNNRSDHDNDGQEHERRISKRRQGAVVDLTYSDSGEEPPLTKGSGLKARATVSEDERLESCGSGGAKDHICGAILTYSPPRSSKPRKILLAGASSDDFPRARKLLSPKKKALQIPLGGHGLSSDKFWDQEVTNNWIDTHTPHKTPHLTRPPLSTADHISEVPSSGDDEVEEVSGPVASRTTSSKQAKLIGSEGGAGSKRAFNMRKKELAEEFLRTVDDKISGGEVAKKTASTGGIKIVWSKTLRTTAGTAKWRMEKSQNPVGQVQLGDASLSDKVRHHATIDLSEKVVDSEEKLYNVLCHEYCHLANYIISNVRKPPHGASFQKWASLCTHTFSNLNVHVTTTHSYEIESKFKWACQTCGYIYKRHSQSIDITRHTCGACKGGKLAQTHPPAKEKRPITEYQTFMKENFGRIKAENPGTPQSDIMKIVAGAYRAAKSAGNLEKTTFVEAGDKKGGLEDMFGGLKV